MIARAAFENLELFETTQAFAAAGGWLLWSNPVTKSMAAKESGKHTRAFVSLVC
jgi:hypothetical protein